MKKSQEELNTYRELRQKLERELNTYKEMTKSVEGELFLLGILEKGAVIGNEGELLTERERSLKSFCHTISRRRMLHGKKRTIGQ